MAEDPNYVSVDQVVARLNEVEIQRNAAQNRCQELGAANAGLAKMIRDQEARIKVLETELESVRGLPEVGTER